MFLYCNLDALKRSNKELPLSENVEVLHLIRGEKNSYSAAAKIYSKRKSFICESVEKEKGISASFSVAPQTIKVMATVA